MDEMSLSTRKEIKNCIHSRKIQAFAANPNHAKFEIFKRHLRHCSACQRALVQENELIASLEVMIPYKSLLESQVSDIKAELKESLRGLEIVDRTSYRFRALTASRTIIDGVGDTVRNLIRPKYGVWMAFALGISYFFSR